MAQKMLENAYKCRRCCEYFENLTKKEKHDREVHQCDREVKAKNLWFGFKLKLCQKCCGRIQIIPSHAKSKSYTLISKICLFCVSENNLFS